MPDTENTAGSSTASARLERILRANQKKHQPARLPRFGMVDAGANSAMAAAWAAIENTMTATMDLP
jgi:hypothetical protein